MNLLDDVAPLDALLQQSEVIRNLQDEISRLKEIDNDRTLIKDTYDIKDLPLSKPKIYQLINSGELISCVIDGRRLILREDWLKFCKARRDV